MDMTDIRNQTALVTGASRGLGKAFVAELLARGAAKVYATARDPKTVDASDSRVIALPLDVTSTESVRELAAHIGDLTILINNAGVYAGVSPITGDLDEIRAEFETNFFGPLNVTRAFAPIIVENGGGAVVNVHSVLSWIAVGGSYSATKAALWSATNAMRLELAPQKVQVLGLHLGYMDTDMAANIASPKIAPGEVARLALDGVEAGEHEVLADDLSRQVRRGLSADLSTLYPQLAVAV
jgi:NAD(P)-dependent dehydrogenase (short-subunit alcohol dehydrogenase family)